MITGYKLNQILRKNFDVAYHNLSLSVTDTFLSRYTELIHNEDSVMMRVLGNCIEKRITQNERKTYKK